MKEYRPIVNGKASIGNYEITLCFLTTEQCSKVIRKLLKWDYPVNFEFSKTYDNELNTHKYILEITDITWAQNLVEIAKIIETAEYTLGS